MMITPLYLALIMSVYYDDHSIILSLRGALAHGVSSFPKYFVFASLGSFICLQAVYQLSGPVCKATWNGCPSYSASYLHFKLCD